MSKESIIKKYEHAVESFTEKVKQDPNVLAILLMGSLAYDTVWEKSDIDMAVLIREQPIKTSGYSILEDDIVINVEIITRNSFKRLFEKNNVNAFFGKGKVIYTTDDSFAEYFEEMKKFGSSDREQAIFFAFGEVICYMEKIEKWIKVKNDPMYARYYVIKAAEAIAFMEICRLGDGEMPTREVLINATRLSPDTMKTFYQEPMNKILSSNEILELVDKIDQYLESNLEIISKSITECMGDGELKTMTMLSNYYRSHYHFISHIFEYLSLKGLVEKVSQTIRLTPKGKMIVDELAFIFVPSREAN